MKKSRALRISHFSPALVFIIFAGGYAAANTRRSTDFLAASPSDSPLRKVKLVVLDAGSPGSVKVGFHVELEPEWHLYWSNPGDAGLPPSARWTLPPGFAAGPLRHPVPAKSIEDGIISFMHKDDVLLVCDITFPAAGKPTRSWEASAVLEWMACRESCVTGETAVRAVFPPDAQSLAEGRLLMAKYAGHFPKPLSESGLTAEAGRAAWTGSAWNVEIFLAGVRTAEADDFFAYPIEGFVIENSGVSCREGKILLPLVPSRGPGSPPPQTVGGVVIVGGRGYDISVPVSLRPDHPDSSLVVKGLISSPSRR